MAGPHDIASGAVRRTRECAISDDDTISSGNVELS